MRSNTLIAAFAILLLAGFGCGAKPAPGGSAKLSVAASFYPMAHFAAKVGGDLVTVTNVTPAGAEPHDYEPTPQQVAALHDADLLLYNGGGIDNWAERMAPSLAAGGVATLEVGAAVDAKLAPPEGEEELAVDPHFWLDPPLAAKEVTAIRDALIARDPTHAEVYRANAAGYLAELARLDAEFRSGLASCDERTAVTSHAAFAYVAQDYGFVQLPIAGLSPDEEPSAGQLAKVAAQAKAEGIRYIFFETLVSPQLASTIAGEIGAQTLVFNPLEGLTEDELAAGKDYLSVQRENLANLRIALQCR